MKYLVVYDISSSQRWRKVFKFLKNKGLNVQLSCFEIEVKTRDELMNLVYDLEDMIDKSLDSVFFFPISRSVEGLTVKLGRQEELNESKVI